MAVGLTRKKINLIAPKIIINDVIRKIFPRLVEEGYFVDSASFLLFEERFLL